MLIRTEFCMTPGPWVHDGIRFATFEPAPLSQTLFPFNSPPLHPSDPFPLDAFFRHLTVGISIYERLEKRHQSYMGLFMCWTTALEEQVDKVDLVIFSHFNFQVNRQR